MLLMPIKLILLLFFRCGICNQCAGMATAKRKLQSAIGVADDGIIGPITLHIINSSDLNDVLSSF